MDSYANIWPSGGLFCFSGVDGETRFDEPLVLAGREDGIGWDFWLEPRPRLLANVGGKRLRSRNHPGDFVLPDCWFCNVRHSGHKGVVEGAFVDRATIHVRMVFAELDEDEVPELFPVGEHSTTETGLIFSGDGWWLAMEQSAPGIDRRAGLAISYESEKDAVDRARAALDQDIRALINKRLGFYVVAKAPEAVVDLKRRTFVKAAGVLKMNVESTQGRFRQRWFRADPTHHRRVRPWDAVFHTLGLQHIHRELAHEAIRSVLAGQQSDGRIPLSIGPGEDDVSPDLSHPPLLAWLVCQKFERYKDGDFVKSCYRNLAASVRWYEKNRRNENGLYGWRILSDHDAISGARGAESAMSNSPRFDDVEQMTAVDLSSYMANEYRALEIIAIEIGNSEDAARWRARRREVSDAVNALLWDTEDLFYYDLDADGRYIPVKTTAGFMPMFARIPDRDQAEALRMHLTHPHEFWTQFPAASVSEDEAQYSQDMWRGATWPTVNVLLYQAMINYQHYEEAHDLAHKTVNEVSYRYALSGCLYEYYDPLGSCLPSELPRKGAPGAEGGAGFGVIEEHQATAAAYIHLIHEMAAPR